jgi:hypothetical protein
MEGYMGEHDKFFVTSSDQFAADVAVKLERLHVAAGLLESAISRSREDHAALATRMDLTDGRCRDLEARAAETEASIVRLADSHCDHGKELEQVRVLRKVLDEIKQHLSDPTQKVSYATHHLISQLAIRVECLETRDANRKKMRNVVTFAAAAIVIVATIAAAIVIVATIGALRLGT